MPDLTLREALEQYEAECREVLGKRALWLMDMDCLHDDVDMRELIYACVMWLAGKGILNSWGLDFTIEHNEITGGYWSEEPLRFFLNEVRGHMKNEH